MNKQAAHSPPKKRFFYGYVIVIASVFILMLVYGLLYSYGVFIKPIAGEMGWSRATTSGAYSVGMIITGLLYIVTGRINDRFGPRVLMTACGFLLGAGCLLMSQVHSVWQLYLFWGLIIGMGESGGIVPIMSTIARWFVKRRGLMTGFTLAGVGMGQIVLPPVITFLINNYGWRIAFIYLGAGIFVLLVIISQFMRRHPEQMSQQPYGESAPIRLAGDAKEPGIELAQAFRTRQFWFLAAAFFGHGYLIQSTLVHIVPHATDLNISAITASTILSFIGGMSIVGRLGLGSAGDRIGYRTALVIAYALSVMALLWIQVVQSLWMFYIFAVLFGVGYGGQITLLSPTLAKLFGLRAHGVILGVVFFACQVGGSLGPFISGRVYDVTGVYTTAFWIGTAVAVSAVIASAMLRPLSRDGKL